jgi:hypothetical protein
MTNQSGLTEYVLKFSDQDDVMTLSGPTADAKRIMNVLLGNGRAGDFDLGVDIPSYLFEVNDSTTINEIVQNSSSQIKQYCPDTNLLQFQVDQMVNEQDPRGNTIIFGASLGQSNGTTYDFATAVQSPNTGQTIISSLTI